MAVTRVQITEINTIVTNAIKELFINNNLIDFDNYTFYYPGKYNQNEGVILIMWKFYVTMI